MQIISTKIAQIIFINHSLLIVFSIYQTKQSLLHFLRHFNWIGKYRNQFVISRGCFGKVIEQASMTIFYPTPLNMFQSQIQQLWKDQQIQMWQILLEQWILLFGFAKFNGICFWQRKRHFHYCLRLAYKISLEQFYQFSYPFAANLSQIVSNPPLNDYFKFEALCQTLLTFTVLLCILQQSSNNWIAVSQSYFSYSVYFYLLNQAAALSSLFSNTTNAKYDLVSPRATYQLLYLFGLVEFVATCIFISNQILLHSIPTKHSLCLLELSISTLQSYRLRLDLRMSII